MTLSLDFPQCRHAPLSRIDPRWKLAAFLLAALGVALLKALPPALSAFAGTLGLVLLARLPVRWYAVRLGCVALFLGLFLIWLPFLPDESGAVWDVGGIALSPAGLALAASLLLKALSVVSLMLALLATAPLYDTFKAAHALHVPGILVQLLLLTYRYVFLLADEFVRLRTALRVRGYRNRGNLQSYRTIGQVAGTLLVRGHERAERVGQAMRCRGFDGRFRSLHEFRTRLADVLFFGLMLASTLTLVIWDFLGR